MKLSFELGSLGGKEDLKDKITKKFNVVEKYLSKVKEDFHRGFVRVSKGERWGYKVKVDMRLPGKEVVVESKAAKLLDAVDQAQAKASRMVRKYFERMRDKRRKVR